VSNQYIQGLCRLSNPKSRIRSDFASFCVGGGSEFQSRGFISCIRYTQARSSTGRLTGMDNLCCVPCLEIGRHTGRPDDPFASRTLASVNEFESYCRADHGEEINRLRISYDSAGSSWDTVAGMKRDSSSLDRRTIRGNGLLDDRSVPRPPQTLQIRPSQAKDLFMMIKTDHALSEAW